MTNWWQTDDKLMTNWWQTDDELMTSWWRADGELMPNLSIECFRTLKPISGGMDGWMGWLSLGCATYRASLGANKLSVYNSESLCKMFVRKEEILAGKIPVFWFHSLMPVAWNKNQERESSRINISSFMNWHSLLLLVWIRFRQTLLG